VSHIIPYLRLPQLGKLDKLVIRGEFIIKKALFADKYSKEFSNPRNFVAGVINSKTKTPSKYKDLDFVSYELIHPVVKPSEQFEMLAGLDIDVVWNEFVGTASALTNELLSEKLVELRESYIYEIDGVIVSDDKVYDRTTDNPEHAFAFKMVLSDQVAEVKVLDVLWSPSKDGYLKPRVQVEPVVLGGAKIEYATGFNAKFIEDNKIGVGAVIELVRSGDVIPHILKVVKPAATAMMPDVPWKWNATHVDAVLENKSSDETVMTKTVTLFFKHLDTAGMGPGNVRKLIEAGFIGIPAVIHATVPELQAVLGKKTGQAVFDNIKTAINKASLAELMTATNVFGRGFGDKRFVGILESIPDVLTGEFERAELVKRVASVKGMSKTSAEEFVTKLPEFKTFMEEAGLTAKLAQKVEKKGDSGHALFGKKIVMTGFRDKELTAEIEAVGGEIAGSVSKNTFVVLVKDKDEDTGKAEQARKLEIPLMTPDEFKTKYL
jgi:NAD-dependent DNA ligase